MRVVVITGRGFADEKLLAAKLARYTGGLKELVVYTRRRCRPVQDWCFRRVPRITYLVWQDNEPDADMLKEAQAVVVFRRGPCRDTNALIVRTRRAGLKVRVVDTEEDE